MDITLESPLDMHIHLRERDMLALVAPFSAAPFAGGVVMPNLVEPVDSLARLRAYRAAVRTACGEAAFEPYMTLFFRNYSREELAAAKGDGPKAVRPDTSQPASLTDPPLGAPTDPETARFCAAAPPPEWTISPLTLPAVAAAWSRTWMVAPVIWPATGAIVTLDEKALLSRLNSKPPGAAAVTELVRFEPAST